MVDKQQDMHHIIECIQDAEKVLACQYIDNQIRAFYEQELAYYQSILNTLDKQKAPKLTVPLF